MTENTKISIQPNPNGDYPQVDPTAYIHPSAQIIGNVHIGPEVFIGPNAVIRADEADPQGRVNPIEIAAQCNVQDAVIIHAHAGTNVTVGPRTSLAHGCIIHGPCSIAADCFIGFKAVIYNAELSNGVLVNASATIQDVILPPNTLVPPAAAVISQTDIKKLTSKTTGSDSEFMQKIINKNITLAKTYQNQTPIQSEI